MSGPIDEPSLCPTKASETLYGTTSAIGLIGLGKIMMSHIVSLKTNILDAKTTIAEDLAEH